MEYSQIDIVETEVPPIHVKRLGCDSELFKIISSNIEFGSQVSTGYKWINPSNENIYEYCLYDTETQTFYTSSFCIDSYENKKYIRLFTGVGYAFDEKYNTLEENYYFVINYLKDMDDESLLPVYEKMYDELNCDIPDLIEYKSLGII